MGDPCILSGVAKMTEDGSITVDFNIKYSNVRMEYQGHKVEGRAMVVGSWKAYHDDPTFSSVSGSFSLLQVSEDVMDLLLSPRVLVWNRARLLWHLAIEFAKRQVKRRTWKALHERRMRRKQFLRLYVKMKGPSLLDSELGTYLRLVDGLTVADLQCYQSLGDVLYRIIPDHA